MAHEQQPSQKNIVILGGSYAGVSAAHYILKNVIPDLPDKASYKVVLVSAASQTMCRPACPRAMISDDLFDQKKLFVITSKQFDQYPAESFQFIHGTATELYHDQRHVIIRRANGGPVEDVRFHALIIATGASTLSPLLGLNGNVDQLRASWSELRRALPNARSIVIAGGGPAGVEVAGELAEHLNGRPGWFRSGAKQHKVQITVVTSGAHILPALRPALATKAEQYLAKLGVTVVKNRRVKAVIPAGAGTTAEVAPATIELDDGMELQADIYVPATGTKPNTSFVDPSLLAADGRVATEPASLRVTAVGPRIYAIGDVSSYAAPAIHQILNAVPVLGASVKHDLLLAANVDVDSAKPTRVFKEDKRETQLVPIGKSAGVGAVMGYAVPSLLVWLIKGRDYWLWTTGSLWNGKHWAKA